MVLQTERYNGGYMQPSYSVYQGPASGYTSYQSVTEQTTPYFGFFPVSTYPSSHGPNHQSGWSDGGDYYGNGASHYTGSAMVAPTKPTIDNYGSSRYENSYTHGNSNNHVNPYHQTHGNLHGQGHGSPHHQGHGSPYGQGHGSPHHHGHGSPHHQGHGSPNHQGYGIPHSQGHGSPYGSEKTQGLGGAITTQINKLTHGHNNYGNGSPNYGHSPSGFNHGYQQPSWTVKGLDDDE